MWRDGYSVLPAANAFWRPSNQIRVQNTDLAAPLGATPFGRAHVAAWVPANTLDMTPEVRAFDYPDGPHSMSP